jgi:hypothetical protein
MAASFGSVGASLGALLTLADQRLPSGGHVHSGGIEQAVADGLVHDAATLQAFLRRRLLTAGLVAAGIAAAATELTAAGVVALDAETDARMPSPAQREASRPRAAACSARRGPPGRHRTPTSPGRSSAPARTTRSCSVAQPGQRGPMPRAPQPWPPTSP